MNIIVKNEQELWYKDSQPPPAFIPKFIVRASGLLACQNRKRVVVFSMQTSWGIEQVIMADWKVTFNV